MKTKVSRKRSQAAPGAPITVHIPELDDARINELAELFLRWIDDGTLDRFEATAAASQATSSTTGSPAP